MFSERRHGLLAYAGLFAAVTCVAGCNRMPTDGPDPPNVILIMTDDQGYGDLGIHGNPHLDTPNLDRLAGESVQFQWFYVSPVCAPTRASLLTGRYNYRTGAVDTYLGRALMHPDETTVAEMLSAAGYHTGIFGKWHLGDTYPLRAIDQGFASSLVLNGGGIGQPSDPVGGEHYFDTMLRRDGEWVPTSGYISDVITDAAIAFIRSHQEEPFFTYLAYNAPHTPLEVPDEAYEKYRAKNLEVSDFPTVGQPIGPAFNPDVTARIYGMVENIDDNVGRLLATLDELALSDRTVVMFLTDNGPQQTRYNAGFRQLKGTVYEGGIHVPLFVRWPGTLTPGTVDQIAAHIDVTPTILELTGAAVPAAVRLDGRSLVPLLQDGDAPWPDRTLFFQWHRGDAPEPRRAFAARSARYKLVQAQGNGANAPPPDAPLELYDMTTDPYEQRNIAADAPEIVAGMTSAYDAWFDDVTSERDYSDSGVARIAIGAPEENPVRLTRQDWRGPDAGWTPTSVGYWEVNVRNPGPYDVTVRWAPLDVESSVTLAVGDVTRQAQAPAGTATVTIAGVRLPTGSVRLEAWVDHTGSRVGMIDAVVTRVP